MCEHCHDHNPPEQTIISNDGPTRTRVTVVQQIMSSNNALADQNRAALEAAGVLGINVMASPGAGKTSLILRTIEELHDEIHLGVVEGDTAPVTLDTTQPLQNNDERLHIHIHC